MWRFDKFFVKNAEPEKIELLSVSSLTLRFVITALIQVSFICLRSPIPNNTNLLTLGGYFLYHQVSNKKLNVLVFMSTKCIYVSCMALRAKRDYFLYGITLLVHCSRDGICFLHGTNCIFIYNSG